MDTSENRTLDTLCPGDVVYSTSVDWFDVCEYVVLSNYNFFSDDGSEKIIELALKGTEETVKDVVYNKGTLIKDTIHISLNPEDVRTKNKERLDSLIKKLRSRTAMFYTDDLILAGLIEKLKNHI